MCKKMRQPKPTITVDSVVENQTQFAAKPRKH